MPNKPLTCSRSLLPASVFLVLALVAQPAAAQAVLFSDNFHRTTGLGSNWTVLYGAYTTNGTYAVSGTPPINGNLARALPSLGTDDYAVKADVIIPTGSVDSGIFARSFDPTYFNMTLYALRRQPGGAHPGRGVQ